MADFVFFVNYADFYVNIIMLTKVTAQSGFCVIKPLFSRCSVRLKKTTPDVVCAV